MVFTCTLLRVKDVLFVFADDVHTLRFIIFSRRISNDHTIGGLSKLRFQAPRIAALVEQSHHDVTLKQPLSVEIRM